MTDGDQKTPIIETIPNNRPFPNNGTSTGEKAVTGSRAVIGGGIALALVLIGPTLTGPAPAGAAAYTAEGTGSMKKGRLGCSRQALDQAREKALTRRIIKLAGHFDDVRHTKMLKKASTFIKREKVSRFKALDGDLCRVKGAFRFDDRKLKAALKRSNVGGKQVGAVLRYIVDGRLAESQGLDPLVATNALNAELKSINCRPVDLLYQHDEFARRMRTQTHTVLTGNEADSTEALQVYGLSHAQAVINTLQRLREQLQRDLRLGKSGFDRVVLGVIALKQRGRDPDSPNNLVTASAYLSLYDVATQDLLNPEHAVMLQGLGPDRAIARHNALKSVTGYAVDALNRQKNICG